MTYGARNYGTRSYGDSAPAGAGIITPGGGADLTGTGTMPFGALTIAGTSPNKTGTATMPFGTLLFGTAASPGTGGAGVLDAIPDRPVTHPFEYSFRYADVADLLGLTMEQAAIMEERDRQLENFLSAFMPDLVFSLPGAVRVSTSPVFRSRGHYRVDRWIMSLGTAGTSTTTVWVLVDGNRTVKLELASGETEIEVPRYALLSKDESRVTVEVTAAGAGAENLTIQGVIRV